MKTDKKTTRATKTGKSSNAKKQKETIISNPVSEKKIENSGDSNVSVFTKTTNPKVIIKSENLTHDYNYSSYQNRNKNKLIKLVCFMIMCVIILMTFFLSLKTYSTVNELSNYILL